MRVAKGRTGLNINCKKGTQKVPLERFFLTDIGIFRPNASPERGEITQQKTPSRDGY